MPQRDDSRSRGAALNRHVRQRVAELGPAAAANPISPPADRENAAKIAMVAAKEKFEHCRQPLNKPILNSWKVRIPLE